MSNILAIDTSTHACTAAVSVGDEIIEQFQVAPQQHANLILPMIQSLLDEASLSLSQLDAVAFGCGPGSFMGIRIATGVAQGLAFGIDRPVIAVSSLQTLAQTAYQQKRHKKILAAWDARMNGVYWGAYQVDNNGLMQSVLDDQLSEPNDIVVPNDAWLAAGNAWQVYADQLQSQCTQCFSETLFEIYPHAGAMALIANHKFNRNEITAAQDAQPVYLRNNVAKKKIKQS